MKNLLKKSGFKTLATLLLLIGSQTSVFADANSNTPDSQPLSGGMVVFYFAVLLFLIIAPAFKKSTRV